MASDHDPTTYIRRMFRNSKPCLEIFLHDEDKQEIKNPNFNKWI